jgi:hypothetical protein
MSNIGMEIFFTKGDCGPRVSFSESAGKGTSQTGKYDRNNGKCIIPMLCVVCIRESDAATAIYQEPEKIESKNPVREEQRIRFLRPDRFESQHIAAK